LFSGAYNKTKLIPNFVEIGQRTCKKAHSHNTHTKANSILVGTATLSVPAVAARSKEWVCGRSPAEIVGSNPTGGMDVCVL
jgi:hypothetical protein